MEQRDYSIQFRDVLWELRQRKLSQWERLVAEEILLRSYGAGQPDLPVGKLDDLAAVLGISKGNLHGHLESLVTYEVLGRTEREDKHPEIWWLKEINLWTIARRIEPEGERAKRALEGDANLRHTSALRRHQPALPGLEPPMTDAEVSADAALERTDQHPSSCLSAANSTPVNLVDHRQPGRVPESGTGAFQNPEPNGSRIRNGAVPESGTVPDSGTGFPLPVCSARPGSEARKEEARLARQSVPTVEAGTRRAWRQLSVEESALLDGMEAWFLAGGDCPEGIAHYRPTWEGRIRRGKALVERCLLDAQIEVRDKPDVVRKSRGGLLKFRYDEGLRRLPPKVPGAPLKAPPVANGPAVQVPPAVQQPGSDLTFEQRQAELAKLKTAVAGRRKP